MSGETLINQVVKYLDRQPEVLAAYIFGSLARGCFRADSDVDVAVLLAPTVGDKLARFEKRLDLEMALEQQVHRPVQVVDLELAPPSYNTRFENTAYLSWKRTGHAGSPKK